MKAGKKENIYNTSFICKTHEAGNLVYALRSQGGDYTWALRRNFSVVEFIVISDSATNLNYVQDYMYI